MGVFAVTDPSGALGVVGRFLRGISSMAFHLSSPATNEKYARIYLDDVLVASGNIPTGGLSLSYGEVQLSEGVHTVKCYVWNLDPGNHAMPTVSTYTVEITVKNYTAPVISAFSAQRCLANGTPNGSGVYVRYALTAAIDPVTVGGVDRNAPLIALRYREKGAEGWTTVQLSDEDFAWNEAGAVVAALTLPASITFDFGAYVSDRWKFAAAETALPRDVRPFNARMINGHLSTCIGTLADEEGKHKVVQPAKFTEGVEFVKAPEFDDPAAAREALGIGLLALGIQTGQIDSTLPSGGKKTGNVVFPLPYTSAPRLLLSFTYPNTASINTVIKYWVAEKSETGFKWEMDSSGSATYAFTLEWLAIGTIAPNE